MRYQGRITNWKDDQGFGFITMNGCENQVFVHINAFKNKKRRPVGNEIVTYDVNQR
ncbi:cold shock domain-containing protein [Nitrosomonas aestuarii]|uniref:cold shock domain-containing protein n=1 Tax=Nitrosomonas aestuarii TaxID=52441 RepID=UPI000D31F877|nr:cold shock domain-containing protein [Nitrosomonas aestuarii]PTN11573.1 cold shock CspA family protein [Nitrosomonas aestuarii]